MSSEVKLIANPDFMLREIADEHILIPVGDAALKLSGMITLNDSGVLLWNALKGECTKDDLVKIILDEYDVSTEAALSDIESFVEEMLAVDIIRYVK